MHQAIATPSGTALLLALGFLTLLPTSGHASDIAAPSSRERSQLSLTEGDTASEAGDSEGALSKYEAAYRELPEADRGSYFGSMPVRKAMRAYEKLIAQESIHDTRQNLLKRQRDLLDEFLAAVDEREGAVEEVGQDVVAELEEIRRAIDAEIVPEPPDPPPENETPPPELEPVAPTNTDSEKPPRDGLGLGLVIGGGTALGIGLGVSVGRWTIRSQARDNVDSNEDFAEGTQARADYLAEEDERARNFLIAGSVVAGVGLAVAIGGGIRLALHRRRAAPELGLHVFPEIGPKMTGLTLHRRF